MNKKLVTISLLTLVSFTSCKDVDKNPTSCGYDFIQEADGRCTSVSYLGLQQKKENNQNVFSNMFINSVLVENQDNGYSSYQLNFEGMNEKLAGPNPVDAYDSIYYGSQNNRQMVLETLEKNRKLSRDYYVDGIYDEITKLETISNKLAIVAPEEDSDLARIYQKSDGFNLEDSVKMKILVSHINKVAQDENSEAYPLKIVVNNYGANLVTGEGYYKGKILDNAQIYFENSEECDDAVVCTEILKEDINTYLYRTIR